MSCRIIEGKIPRRLLQEFSENSDFVFKAKIEEGKPKATIFCKAINEER